jgi:hypothetical protein
LDEASGTSITDSSANASTGTVQGSVDVNQTAKFSKGYYLAGSASEYLTFPKAVLDGVTSFTVEMWYKGDETRATNYTDFFNATVSSGDTNQFLFIIDNATEEWYVYDGVSVKRSALVTDPRDGEWHHIAFVRSGTVGYIYVDFVLERTLTVSATAFSLHATDPVVVGGNLNGGASPVDNQWIKGWADEIRFSNVARTFTPAGTRYIYYDGTSTLAVTTDMSLVRGDKKQLLAIMQPSKYYGPCAVTLVGMDGTYIDGSKVKTGRIESSDGRSYWDLNGSKMIWNDGTNDRIKLAIE